MSRIRHFAVEEVSRRTPAQYRRPAENVSSYFGSRVFDLDCMRQHVSAETMAVLRNCIEKGEKIDMHTADAVAAAMKNWAISQGATHYTHWFHPLRGSTAEKHDAFFMLSDGKPVESFKGSSLVQQEPDASSFPNGGIRTTFEARGYTAWDPSSPAFIYETAGAKTLCIPTIFVAYTGHALDHKAPLLKAIDAVNQAATKICQYFDKDVQWVKPVLGAEQEYFLVDRSLYYARPDLMMTGRTIFGHAPARGQQLSDHYFGAIPRRVTNFMQEFETEALRLGIPVRTRHNEVAPGQYEVAPQFEEANLATDHNMLLMDIMERIGEKHHFKILFHEKPFKGINGSGKHNNWSLVTNTGKNLLAPTGKPRENLQFLTFLICTLRAVYEYADILRASIANAGNDLRLGAHEAPPAIISVFLGTQLSGYLEEFEKNANIRFNKGDNVFLKLGISKIPEILLDNTDRNRTSPFAFTGNKFEFRAVGSSANCAAPMTVLNTAVAEMLDRFRQQVETRVLAGEKKELAIVEELQKSLKIARPIIYEGDNYTEEWLKEAEARQLSNSSNTPQALEAYRSPQSVALFEKHRVFTDVELEARTLLLLEEYILKIQIESRVCGDLAQNHITPVAIKYLNELIKNHKGLSEMGITTHFAKDIASEISGHISQIREFVVEMTNARKRANAIFNIPERAQAYCNEVRPYIDKIRYHVDKLELLVDDEDWPLAKYRELLHMK